MTFKSSFAAGLTGLSILLAASGSVAQIPASKPAKEKQKDANVVFEDQLSKKSIIVLKNASPQEKKTMEALQNRGINSTNALATIMGNIKQESKFHSNICEGGARVGYSSCRRGGYGLIQWTTSSRYYGLGRHAKRMNMNPSTLEAQLSYMFHEPQWKKVEAVFRTPGYSIERYMNHAYKWLGWGIKGLRVHYAYDYARRMESVGIH